MVADVDECRNDPCGANSVCHNLPGGFECECQPGYKPLPGRAHHGCVDVDECLDPHFPCGARATCVNAPGSFYCQCPPGFTGNPKIACQGEQALMISTAPTPFAMN